MIKKIQYLAYPCLLLGGILFGSMTNNSSNNQSQRNFRTVSNVTYDEANISKDAHEFSSSFSKVKTPADFDKILSTHLLKLEDHRKKKTLESLPSDYRFLVSFLYPIEHLKGVGFRVLGFTSRPGIKASSQHKKSHKYNHPIIKNLFVSKLQGASSIFDTYFPNFGSVMFDWITQPAKGQTSDFNMVSDLQNFVIKNVYSNVQKMLEVQNSINDVTIESPLTIDSIIMTGSAYAVPKERRYYNIYKHELASVKSYLNLLSHNLIFYAQYNRNDYINFEFNEKKELAKQVHILSNQGLPMMDAVKEFNKWKDLFTIRTIPFSSPIEGKTWMQTAHHHIMNHIEAEEEVIIHLREADQQLSDELKRHSFYNPNRAFISSSRMDKHNALRRKIASENNVPIRNWLTGDIASVNYRKFYDAPPSDLKVFLPIGFNTDEDKKLKMNGQKYVNYRYGNPESWNISAWNSYFPSVKTNEDVRTLAQTLKNNSATKLSNKIIGRFVSISADYKVYSPFAF